MRLRTLSFREGSLELQVWLLCKDPSKGHVLRAEETMWEKDTGTGNGMMDLLGPPLADTKVGHSRLHNWAGCCRSSQKEVLGRELVPLGIWLLSSVLCMFVISLYPRRQTALLSRQPQFSNCGKVAASVCQVWTKPQMGLGSGCAYPITLARAWRTLWAASLACP